MHQLLFRFFRLEMTFLGGGGIALNSKHRAQSEIISVFTVRHYIFRVATLRVNDSPSPNQPDGEMLPVNDGLV